jgi:hypothetical protein
VTAGYISRERVGRRNSYEVHAEKPLPLSSELYVSDVLATFTINEGGTGTATEERAAARAPGLLGHPPRVEAGAVESMPLGAGAPGSAASVGDDEVGGDAG